MSACQLVETASRDFVIGLGYKIVNFNLFSGRNVKDSKIVSAMTLPSVQIFHFATSPLSAGTSSKVLRKLPTATKP